MSEQLAFDLASVTPTNSMLPELWTPDDMWNATRKDGWPAISQFKEDDRIEWKSAKYDAKELVDYFSMWANTQPYGGILVIGVEKDGVISGCKNVGVDKISEFKKMASDQCADAVFEHQSIEVINEKGEQDYLLIIRVYYRTDKLVETVRNDAFIRSGNTKRRLSEDEKRELRIGKGQISYEKELVPLNYPDDFDDSLIDEFCKQFRIKRGLSTHHTREQILAICHLGKIEGNSFKPNLACAILFSLNPTSIIPGARVRFMRYDGTEEKTGAQYNVVKDIILDGPLPKLIKNMEQAIESQIRNFTRLAKDGKFETKPEYPHDVWLEGLVNSCAHRSYNLKNMNIFIKMFDDRMVFESPGGFPPPVNQDNIYDTHNPRNPYTMNALFYFDYVKCAHEGTRRMRDGMRVANLPAPEFRQREIGTHQVQVTLRNNIDARKEFVEAGALKLLGESVYSGLSSEEKQIINYIAEHKKINVTDAARLLYRDWQTAKKSLDGLVQKSLLDRITKKIRDGKAHYILKRKKMYESNQLTS